LRLSRPELDQSVLPEADPARSEELMARIARAVVERQMTVPAIMLLESVKPLSFLGNQLLIFLDPIVSLVVTSRDYYAFVRMLDDRENLEKLLVAIEEENARIDALRKAEKASRPKRRGLFPLFRHR